MKVNETTPAEFTGTARGPRPPTEIRVSDQGGLCNRDHAWVRTATLLLCLANTACATTGSAWVREGLGPGTNTAEWNESEVPQSTGSETAIAIRKSARGSRVIGASSLDGSDQTTQVWNQAAPTRITAPGKGKAPQRSRTHGALEGKVLGTFRNTYYDFPSESEFSGEPVTLFGAQCKPIAHVARGFFEAVCVQGSGLLANGSPISFNRRDCECADVCPRTQQKICFDALDIARFPWGRGASGTAITPLLTVAVDSAVIPLGTPLYIPEFDGIPRDAARTSVHDGCFLAQDRGLRVQGQHIDVFTGQPGVTQLWNGMVPSNQGVTVVMDSPKCAR